MARGKKPTRKPPKYAAVITSERRHAKRERTKAVGHVTEEQFISRHLYCITIHDIHRMMDGDSEMSAVIQANPKAHKAVCNHPEDGFCGTSISSENLQKVNDILGHKVPHPKEESIDDLGVGEDEVESVDVVSALIQQNGNIARGIRIGGKLYGS